MTLNNTDSQLLATTNKAGAELLGWMQPMPTNLEHPSSASGRFIAQRAITEFGGKSFVVSGAGAKGLFSALWTARRATWGYVRE